jgi:hypothetical protein
MLGPLGRPWQPCLIAEGKYLLSAIVVSVHISHHLVRSKFGTAYRVILF